MKRTQIANPDTLTLRGNNIVRAYGKPFSGVASKPPKARFKPGDRFEYDGGVWEIIYMYRVASEQGIWYHELEEVPKELTKIGAMIEGIGAGSTTPRIIYTAFTRHQDAHDHFRDIYCHGDRSVKTTQELLKLKKV